MALILVTASPTGNATLVAVADVGVPVSADAAMAGDASVTANADVGVPVHVSSIMHPSASLDGALTPVIPLAVALTGTASATGLLTPAVEAHPAGDATLAADLIAKWTATAPLSGTATLSASLALEVSVSTSMTSDSTFGYVFNPNLFPTALLQPAATLEATVLMSRGQTWVASGLAEVFAELSETPKPPRPLPPPQDVHLFVDGLYVMENGGHVLTIATPTFNLMEGTLFRSLLGTWRVDGISVQGARTAIRLHPIEGTPYSLRPEGNLFRIPPPLVFFRASSTVSASLSVVYGPTAALSGSAAVTAVATV